MVHEKIDELINFTNGKANIIIIRDWNAIVGEDEDGKKVDKYGIGIRNERGDHHVEFCR